MACEPDSAGGALVFIGLLRSGGWSRRSVGWAGDVQPPHVLGDRLVGVAGDVIDARPHGGEHDVDRGEPERQAGDHVERVVHAPVDPGRGHHGGHHDGDDGEERSDGTVAGVPAHDEEQRPVERDGRGRVAGWEAAGGGYRVELLHGRAVPSDDEARDHEDGGLEEHRHGEEHAVVPAPPDDHCQ